MDDEALDTQSDVQVPGTETQAPTRSLSVNARRLFFDQVIKQTRSAVGSDWADFQARPQSYLLKVYYENERVHFEVALDGIRDLIEVALHFEDGPVSSAAYLHFFDQRIVEIKHALGAELELERWTASWGRLYYMIPLSPFDAAKAKQTASLLARLIDSLQPLVVEANVPHERVTEQRTGPWRTWRRSRR
jgi:hypothetical protein